MSISSFLGPNKLSPVSVSAANPLPVTNTPASLEHCYDVIRAQYGKIVLVKEKTLFKFGQNDAVGTSEATIMGFAGSEIAETYVSDNLIDRIVSSNNTNTQTMVVEGHTIDGSGLLTFVTQTLTLTGQTPVALTTPVARVSRAYNSSGTVLASGSTIYVYESTSTVTSGVPQTASKVHITVNAAENQSLKCATSFSNVDFGLITHIYADINKKTTAIADIRLKIRLNGGVFRTVLVRTVNTAANGGFDLHLDPYVIVPNNADVIMTATASTADVSISAGFNTYIATVQAP